MKRSREELVSIKSIFPALKKTRTQILPKHNKSDTVDISSYSVLGKISTGASSHVFIMLKKDVLVQDIDIQKIFNSDDKPELLALKCYRQNTSKINILREMNILDKYKHPNLMSAYYFDTRGILMDVGMCLGDVTVESLSQIYSYTLDISKGLKYLHDNGIIYMDLKPNNILLRGDKALITDYGSCVNYMDLYGKNPIQDGKYRLKEPITCTLLYASPESHTLKEKIYYPHDIWSLGIMFYRFLFAKHPFIEGYWDKMIDNHDPTKILENLTHTYYSEKCMFWCDEESSYHKDIISHPENKPYSNIHKFRPIMLVSDLIHYTPGYRKSLKNFIDELSYLLK